MHLIFEVLGSDQGVQELLSAFDHGMNLSTCTAEIRIVVESLPSYGKEVRRDQ